MPKGWGVVSPRRSRPKTAWTSLGPLVTVQPDLGGIGKVGADLDEPGPELGVGDEEVVHPDPAFLFDEVEADDAGDRRAVLSTEDPLELLGRHDGDDPGVTLGLGRLEIRPDVIEPGEGIGKPR